MRPLRRLIWILVVVLASFIVFEMITVSSRPAWVGNLPGIGPYLTGLPGRQ